ncbi:hypothetical protein Amsp01_079580 [Amycolatopsis sp. NBRC 101858]|uniref:hypothetical protein n=1 Tax=Amycolatopsis sp. NBRC 101858 TaxID=3032200 RepID=UPI0024A0BE0C|nr:hypothetical protein [Amycolatopsis sp. NBRC 101858]GLY41935.1 hypothetical protein Amsp01_079580 [Amycolatopsis sp. NBRC 101858]
MARRVAGGATVTVRPSGSAMSPLIRSRGNNRGRVDGWTGHGRMFGIYVSVDGVPRPRVAGKTR